MDSCLCIMDVGRKVVYLPWRLSTQVAIFVNFLVLYGYDLASAPASGVSETLALLSISTGARSAPLSIVRLV